MTIIEAYSKKISVITNGKVTLRLVKKNKNSYFVNVTTSEEYVWEFEELMDDWEEAKI